MADETTPTPSGEPTSDEKVMGAIAYLGILFLVPLLAKKDSKFAMFHAKQGMVLFIAEIIAYIAGFMLAFIPYFGWYLDWLIYVVVGILALIGLIQALSGKYWELPVLGAWAKTFKF